LVDVKDGLGILLSALDTMPGRQIVFVHGNLNEGTQAFKKTIDALVAKHSNLKILYRYSDSAQAGMYVKGLPAQVLLRQS